MSKRVLALATIWLLLSTLVQATGRPQLDGTAVLSVKSRQPGTYTVEVTDVTHAT